MFTESLPSNERLFSLRYSGFRAPCHNINSDRSVSVNMTKLRAGRPRKRGSRHCKGRDSSFLYSFQAESWGHTAFYSMGNGAISPRVNLSGLEPGNSPLSSVEVKNASSWPYRRSRICFHGVVLNEAQRQTYPYILLKNTHAMFIYEYIHKISIYFESIRL
jgi:hypothetical protein